MDMFSALLGKSLSGGGGSEPVLISKSISSNGTYNASDDNADGYSSVSVSVPNSYTQSDEGKVVSNGALVAQGSDTVTENGTVDTTLISSLLVNVSGGTGTAVKLTTQTAGISSSDLFLINTGTYIFLFGFVTNSKSYAISGVQFDVPNDFDLNSIAYIFVGAPRWRIDSAGSTYGCNPTIDTANKQITLDCFTGSTSYIVGWTIAT